MQGAYRFPFILFDLGSTLIYFDGQQSVYDDAARAAVRALQQMGVALQEEGFLPAYAAMVQDYYNRRSDDNVEFTAAYVLQQALRQHGQPELPPEQIQQALRAFYALPQAHFRREADALATLETLLARGCRLGIVSNASDDEDVQTLVDQAGLRPYFDFVLTSGCAGYRKPHPIIFQQALAHWDAVSAQAVMVGDTVGADIAGASGLGMAAVWIRRRADTPENRAELQRYPAAAVIDTLADLPAALDRLAHLHDGH